MLAKMWRMCWQEPSRFCCFTVLNMLYSSALPRISWSVNFSASLALWAIRLLINSVLYQLLVVTLCSSNEERHSDDSLLCLLIALKLIEPPDTVDKSIIMLYSDMAVSWCANTCTNLQHFIWSTSVVLLFVLSHFSHRPWLVHEQTHKLVQRQLALCVYRHQSKRKQRLKDHKYSAFHCDDLWMACACKWNYRL